MIYLTKKTRDRIATNNIKFAARKKHDNTVAVGLGFKNAQEAFNSIGKNFVALCK